MIHLRYRRSRKVVSVVVCKEADTKEVLEVDMGTIMTQDIVEGEVDAPYILIVVILVMSQDFLPNACSVHIVIVPSL
jgi:hypothetical protein